MRNIWGTDPDLINEDEFCKYCEREVPSHYDTCPARCTYCVEGVCTNDEKDE